MPISATYRALRAIALAEFADVIVSARIVALPTGDPLKLRLDVADGSLLDVFISVSGRYSYHWDRRVISNGDIYRHDNAPQQVRNVACLPGIIGRSLAMPDIHWGYGFPIGGVAATDPQHDGYDTRGQHPCCYGHVNYLWPT